MKSLKKQRRIQVIVITIIALALSTVLIGYAMRDGINFFRSPSDVLQQRPDKNETFRIGGLVQEDSLVRGSGEVINFFVTDGNNSVLVEYSGILPDLFAEGQGMIATGNFIDGKFIASEILAKHDENYMPKEVVDTLKEQGLYQKIDDEISAY